MKITSIPSRCPGWYDPSVPGFVPREDWLGCRVRATVVVQQDPAREMSAVRTNLEAQFPGATLHLIPDFQAATLPNAIEIKGDDETLLRSYLSRLDIPPEFTTEQLLTYLKSFLPRLGLFGVQGLQFQRVIARETLCFKEEVDLDLDRHGLTLVSGVNKDWMKTKNSEEIPISNGAGKSSLVTLPFLGLFGRTFKGQMHDGWARQKTTATAVIESLVKLPDGRTLKVVRTRRPASLRVFLDTDEVTMGKPELSQALIENLTNFPWELLTNSIYIGQREIGSVFGTEKERKELFSRLLGLDRFLDAQEKLRKVLLRRQRAVAETQAEMDAACSTIEEARTGSAEISVALQAAPVVDEKALRLRQRRIEFMEAMIVEHELEIDAIMRELEPNQRAFEEALFKGQDAETRWGILRDQRDKCQALEGQCPTCGTMVTEDALQSYAKAISERMETIEIDLAHFEKVQTRNRTVRKALLEKVQEKRLDNAATVKTIATERTIVARDQEQASARARLEAIYTQKETRIHLLERQYRAHEASRAACLEEQRFVEICVAVVGRNGLPAYLCAVAAPQLNTAAVRYSEAFTDGEIGMLFTMDNGDIDVAIANPHGGENVKDQSAGEMRLAALIAALSFRDVLVPHNILVLDEPSEGLDPANADAFARGLNAVVARFQHVIVISHNERVLSGLEPDFRIEIVKENGIASVVRYS